MTDSQYIRAAIELADAWILYDTGDQDGPEYSAPHRIKDYWLYDICQEDKDALAAQLVRQYYEAGGKALLWREGDPMTTIKDIVDSKVLE